MKLKNSYILLIVMSLFLLISIGSVCAEDSGATDADILSDEGNDITLADGETADTTQKINTTVVSENVKVKESDPVEIGVTVKDNESNTINIAKENITVQDNNTKINFDYNNSIINITDKLNVGNHTLIISYLGNDIYSNSTTSIILSIIGNNTLEVPSTVVSAGETAEIPIKLSDGVDDNTNLLNSTNTELLLISQSGNETISIEDVLSDNKLTIDVAGKVPATLVINYTENGKTISKKVIIKYLSQINTTEVVDITEDKNLTLNVTVLDNNGNPISNITKSNLTISGVKDFSYNSTTNEVKVTGLTKGTYDLTITYNGNELYNSSTKSVLVNVHGSVDINVNKTSIDVNSSKKGEIIIINITDGVDIFSISKDNINITVSYENGNNTTTIGVKSYDISNGTISFELENGNFTTATLVIDYANGESLKNITLKRVYNAQVKAIVNEAEYQSGVFKYEIDDLDSDDAIVNKTITLNYSLKYGTITIGSSISATTDSEGIVSFNNSNIYSFGIFSSSEMITLEVGNHTITLSGSGINLINSSQQVTITKANINIKIDDFEEYWGTDENVTITVTNEKTGTPLKYIIIHLSMPQTTGKDYYFQTDSKGQSKISVKNLISGTYDISVSNNDTTNINKKTVSKKITIVPIPVKISVEASTISYNTGNTAKITITDSDGKPVSEAYVLVIIDKNDKKPYLFLTDAKGQITFSASLGVGSHKLDISTVDNRYSGGSVTKTITVKKATGTIKAPKVTAYYKGGKYFTITLTNSKNNKAIYDAKLNIKVYISKTRYYNYNGNTGANGQLRLLIEYKPGTYKVEVSGADSKNFTAKKITSKIVVKKTPTKLTAKKLTAKKGKSNYFKVTATNKKTKKVIAGVKLNIKVYTGKKSKTYTVKTNSKGIAKLNVKSLKVGAHKVRITSANKYCVAKTTKSKIKITK